MKKLSLIVAIGTIAAGIAIGSSAHALSLQLKNRSHWDIHELYFSPADEDSWGPDQLGDEIIAHGESFTLRKIDRGTYDMKIVDEDGDACTVNDVDFDSSESFTLTEDLLLGCQNATADEEGSDEE